MKMKKLYSIICISLFLNLSGCGDSAEPVAEKEQKPHVWTSQTETIDHAKNTAADIEKTLQMRQEKINNN